VVSLSIYIAIIGPSCAQGKVFNIIWSGNVVVPQFSQPHEIQVPLTNLSAARRVIATPAGSRPAGAAGSGPEGTAANARADAEVEIAQRHHLALCRADEAKCA
jgi:hypothetical protein